MRILPLVLLGSFAAGPVLAAPPDPAKVVGAEDCGECHEEAHEVWQGTAHARGWTELSRSEAARAIAGKLGIRRIKRDERCASCHFLSAEIEGVVKPISGVACESCHGASADWIDLHWDFGPDDADASTETAEHRAERLRRCDEAGMIRPARVAELGSSCFHCHVIADEELLAAGHPATGAFELAAATQGEMRHNFVRGNGDNVRSGVERLRVLHAVGRLLDWQATLRALAGAGEGTLAADRLGARSSELRGLVEGLHQLTPRPEFESALAAASTSPPAEAAAAIGAAASRLADNSDGSDLAGLDELLAPALTTASGG